MGLHYVMEYFYYQSKPHRFFYGSYHKFRKAKRKKL